MVPTSIRAMAEIHAAVLAQPDPEGPGADGNV